jgi:hypothetical protein
LQVEDVQKGASELEKLELEKIPVPVEKSVNEFFYPPLQWPQEEDQNKDENTFYE